MVTGKSQTEAYGIWGSGVALAFVIVAALGLFVFVLFNGSLALWPRQLEEFKLKDGTTILGSLVDEGVSSAINENGNTANDKIEKRNRILVNQGNRDIVSREFIWLWSDEIVNREIPKEAVIIERKEWGPLIGYAEQGSEFNSDYLPSGDLSLTTSDGTKRTIHAEKISRVTMPNALGFFGKLNVYFSKILEFLTQDPRESNTEGGVFPAIFGTILVVLTMTIFVAPLGVLTALYLREYAKQGPLVTVVRISVSNLAGVPSIVFGVFGVGFFVYGLGAFIDDNFFRQSLPTPTFGTGGLLWASITLSLLTLPTVIVSAEEGLAAIPMHVREASYALGATKFETMIKVVLPALVPSILTGVILAIARAAGEVAPLMITGVVKLAPSLPLDGTWPFLHLDRKFMHLGFHIFDVGFQSPNIEASRPMVYMTTLLLLTIVVVLNLGAMVVRQRLRQRYSISGI